jgi:hypothetical protein
LLKNKTSVKKTSVYCYNTGVSCRRDIDGFLSSENKLIREEGKSAVTAESLSSI